MGKRKKELLHNYAIKKMKKQKIEPKEIKLPATVSSDDPPFKQTKWTNRERVLVFASRGISYRARHLMLDLRTLMPHSKAESKLDQKDQIFVINEICAMKNCSKCVFLEMKKKKDLYMWMSNCPKGPSAKFLVENVHTRSELKMTGNCLKGSRPLLSFDPMFDSEPHWSLLKELFIQIFGIPNHHPKSQPFIDHVITFSIADNRIWYRNFQIVEEDGTLAEIGPRFVLNPIRIFEGSFIGETLWINPFYMSPNKHRSLLKRRSATKYIDKILEKKSAENRMKDRMFESDKTDEVFETK